MNYVCDFLNAARDCGGHFAALDNPDGLVEDLREFVGAQWAA
jgi:hypothetical protein